MKILIVTPKRKLITSGGVSSFWDALLPELSKFEKINVKVLEVGKHGKNIFGPIFDQWSFKKLLKEEYASGFLNPSLGSRSFFRDALFAKQLLKKKVPFIVFFRGWNLDFERKVNKNYKKFFLNSFGKADLILVLSQDFKTKIREWGYKGNIIIETTTVDITLLKDFSVKDKFNRMIKSEEIKILFLSRLLKEKGVYEIVRAFKKLQVKYQNIKLIIAGDGKDYVNLENIVRSEKNINMTGHVVGREKIELLKESHIFCLPSYSEGLPNSVLEAMAFGLPIITTRVGGLKTFFMDGDMGYFVEPKNVDELEAKIELLLLDKNKMTKIGKYNYNYAHENLLSNVVAKRIYSHILKVCI